MSNYLIALISKKTLIKNWDFGFGNYLEQLEIRSIRSIFQSIILVPIIVFAVFWATQVSAGTIIKSPAYLGLNNGLVGCWNFDGDYTKVQDCSGNGNVGTITGATRTTGKIGQALSFDGINDGVLITTGNVMGAGAKTVSVWIKPQTVSADQTIISNDAPNITELKIDQGNSDVEFSSNGGTTFASLAVSNIKANAWQQLVAVRNSSNQATFYLNGVQVGTPNQATGSPGSATQTSIGYDDANTTNYFNGLIDEVRIYNRALSASEISRLYRIGLGSTANRITTALDKGLVGHWTFDGPDISGTRAKDRSGNQNHGTLTGANGLPKEQQGKVGSALSFDGVDDYVAADSATLEDYTGNITMSAWIYPRSFGVGNVGLIANAGDNYGLQVDNANITRGFVFYNSSVDSQAPNTIVLDTWQHVVAVCDATSVRMFANGSLVQTLASNCPNGGFTDNFYIGDNRFHTHQFNGLIDDVRIYNRALSAAEISRLYNSTQSKFNSSKPGDVLTNGLVGHWTFDGPDLSGTRAKDRSGNNNHGTLTNGPVEKQGKIGSAFKLDGINDEITTTTSFVNPQDFTISAWFKTASASGKKIVGFESNQTGNASADYDRDIYVTTEGQVRFLWEGGSVDTDLLGSPGFLHNNQWHFAVGTHTSGNVGTLYIDGVSMGTAGGAAQNFTGWWRIGSFKIGAHPAGFDGYFPGLIDEVRIYSRALSSGEVQKLYNMGR